MFVIYSTLFQFDPLGLSQQEIRKAKGWENQDELVCHWQYFCEAGLYEIRDVVKQGRQAGTEHVMLKSSDLISKK